VHVISIIDEEYEQITTLCTGPWSPPTHWKQTVVLFPEATNYEEGDIMGWDFIMKKPTEVDKTSNNRSYVIEIVSVDPEEDHPVPCLCGTVKCELIRHFMSENQNQVVSSVDDDK